MLLLCIHFFIFLTEGFDEYLKFFFNYLGEGIVGIRDSTKGVLILIILVKKERKL